MTDWEVKQLIVQIKTQNTGSQAKWTQSMSPFKLWIYHISYHTISLFRILRKYNCFSALLETNLVFSCVLFVAEVVSCFTATQCVLSADTVQNWGFFACYKTTNEHLIKVCEHRTASLHVVWWLQGQEREYYVFS